MAIKVNGTTVIDDSRNLSNVGGLKTVNGTSIVGSGNISAGASSSSNAVGTYLFGYEDVGNVTEGTTIAGSSLFPAGACGESPQIVANSYSSSSSWHRGGNSLSGTWRRMYRGNYGGTNWKIGLHVRIS